MTRRPRSAFDVYCYRLRKYVGAYYAVLGTVDAVVFTAGVGQHTPRAPGRALSPASSGSGSRSTRNATTGPHSHGPTVVSTDASEVEVLVIPTNEEWEIARQSLARRPGRSWTLVS